MRRTEVLHSLQAEEFRVHADCVRPSFSPDGVYVACGSQNGDIVLWNANTGEMEKVLHGHE